MTWPIFPLDLGYDVEWRVINAADYGRAQRRRRVFIFGWKRKLNYAKRYTKKEVTGFLIKDSLFGKNFSINDEITKHKEINLNNYKDTVEMTNNFSFLFENTGMVKKGVVTTFHSKPVTEDPIHLRQVIDAKSKKDNLLLSKEQIKKFDYLKGGKKIKRQRPDGEIYYYSEGAMSKVDSLDLPGRTMLTSEATLNRSSHLIIDPKLKKKRFITPIEAERLQDFPDNWTDTDMPFKKRYFMMGNALVTGIISRLQNSLGDIIEAEK